jgi:oxygen-independent coproporphyrinogen-3 oxidase
MINEELESAGFNRYEISNFSKKGYESKHNLNYWNNSEYYGFGAAAHGYQNGVRYANSSDIQEYINNPIKHSLEHKLTKQEKLEEEIFLGFRREYGINIKEINKKYNIDFIKKYENILNKYIPDYILQTGTGYKLTLKGLLLSNNILAEFLD